METLDVTDEKTISLVEELNSCFKTNITYGVFAESKGEESFKSEFDGYQKAKNKHDRFIYMSKTTINMLFNRVDTLPTAKGGYLAFVDYVDQFQKHFFSVFLIRDKAGKTFKQGKNGITIGEVIHADTDNLAMACRINIKKYQTHDPKTNDTYLGFISVKQSETSNYFLQWVGVERKKRNTEDSKSLVKILNNITPPDDEDGTPMNQEDFCSRAFFAIKAYKPNEVDLMALSKTLFGEKSVIVEYATSHDIEISTGFVADMKTVKNLIKRFIRADKIELKYPPAYYGDKIKLDTSNSDLILIESSVFAEAVRNQEEEYAKSRGA
jgi:nucleoid-associated protein YejK